MKNRLFTMMAVFGMTVLTFVAQTVSASACIWSAYQPEEPKLLREE
ncbi:cyclic lactone autoinducer peptide [Crassaminicella thermophila]|uniref:Cyclic lactone autoinducer peptide n=1 Tax=Crassaminicella thermophila TaxID=2599308 RepID=A0A5C0SDD7_CRATE|nr:cyclic lactone autoinducer peptide [Crassaminicella thermophila]QEK11244.1 cyclic lactone autoinducer peptide [Crassaminicella thermophila]